MIDWLIRWFMNTYYIRLRPARIPRFVQLRIATVLINRGYRRTRGIAGGRAGSEFTIGAILAGSMAGEKPMQRNEGEFAGPHANYENGKWYYYRIGAGIWHKKT